MAFRSPFKRAASIFLAASASLCCFLDQSRGLSLYPPLVRLGRSLQRRAAAAFSRSSLLARASCSLILSSSAACSANLLRRSKVPANVVGVPSLNQRAVASIRWWNVVILILRKFLGTVLAIPATVLSA